LAYIDLNVDFSVQSVHDNKTIPGISKYTNANEHNITLQQSYM